VSGRRVAAVVAAIAVFATLVVVWNRRDSSATDRATAEATLDRGRVADFEFEVPVGTGERLADGDPVEVIPNPLVVSVGDTIRIRNRDRDPILLGPFHVAAHSVLTQRFVHPGRLVGDCLAHPSGRLVVDVRR
jgi:hypothetical protein